MIPHTGGKYVRLKNHRVEFANSKGSIYEMNCSFIDHVLNYTKIIALGHDGTFQTENNLLYGYIGIYMFRLFEA